MGKSIPFIISIHRGIILTSSSRFLLIFFVFNILPVLLQEDAFILTAGGGWDIIVTFLQPIEELFGRLLIRLSAFGVKLCHDLIQSVNPDLYPIRKSQCAPTTCRRFRFSAHSSIAFHL